MRRNLYLVLIVLISLYDVSLLHFGARASLLTSTLIVVSFAAVGSLAAVIRKSWSRDGRAGGVPETAAARRASISGFWGPTIRERACRIRASISRQIPEPLKAALLRNQTEALIFFFVCYNFFLLYFGASTGVLSAVMVVLLAAVAGVVAWEFRQPASRVLFKPLTVHVLVLLMLSVACFSFYSGFATFSYAITADHLTSWIAPRYIMAHPTFAFVLGYPARAPLFAPYWYVVQSLTHDTPWMNLIPSFLIHIINAFLIFRITGLLCGHAKVLPGLIAAFVFLISVGHHQTLLTFPHCNPIIVSLFGLLSLYSFLKFSHPDGQYRRGALYLSIVFYSVSIGCGLNFIALPLFYVFIMALTFRRLTRDFVYTVLILAIAVGLVWVPGEILRFQYGLIDVAPRTSLSFTYLAERLRLYPYSAMDTLPLFFPGVPAAVVTFFYGTRAVLADIGPFNALFSWRVSLFLLVAPLLFFSRAKALRLYGLLGLMLLLFLPYVLAPRVLNQRHVSQTLGVSSIFLGLLTHYVFDSIRHIRMDWVRKTMNWAVIFIWAVVGGRLAMISRSEIGRFIQYQSSFSVSIEQLLAGFDTVRPPNPRKQIYFLTTPIPQAASLIGNSAQDCYYFYYLATKYKRLPVDFYRYVYVELESGKAFDEERCRNYLLRLPDGAAFGFYTDRRHLTKALQDNPDLGFDDVIVLTWQDGLKQGAVLDPRDL